MTVANASFPCERCQGGTAVVDSRPSKRGLRRRRACIKCGHRFTTLESIPEASPHYVIPRKRTHCSHGHELTGDNLYIDRRGHWHCRICSKIANAEWRERQRRKQ